ncbi:hypothetical protein HDU76_004178 [Blyttiomyces sp. JEL0837]|nr:hypothetical protein HDU76_004178 [Blyttiomyces sp. JEL0837]
MSVSLPSVETPIPMERGTTFVWTNPDPTLGLWDNAQPPDYFPNYTFVVSLSSTSSAATKISLPAYVLPVQEKVGAVTTYFHVAPLSIYQDQGLSAGVWDVSVQAFCGYTADQVTQHCPGINPMNCRPCTGFFPSPATGSMSLLPAAQVASPTTTSTSPGPETIQSTTSSSTGDSTSLSVAGGIGTATSRVNTAFSSGVSSPTRPVNTGDGPNNTTNSSSSSIPLLAGIVGGVVVVIAIIGTIIFFAVKRRKTNANIETSNGVFSDKDTLSRGYSNGSPGINHFNNSNGIISVEIEHKDQQQEEMDLFAVEMQGTMGRPPPSYDQVAAVVHRTLQDSNGGNAGMGSTRDAGGHNIHAAYYNAGDVKMRYERGGESKVGGQSALFDGVYAHGGRGGHHEFRDQSKRSVSERRAPAAGGCMRACTIRYHMMNSMAEVGRVDSAGYRVDQKGTF